MGFKNFEMAKTNKNFLLMLLKIVNSTIGIVGTAMILYGLWMIWITHSDKGEPSWFIQAVLGIGIALCAITCLGFVAANTAYAFYLTFYMITIYVLLVLEAGLIAEIFLNSDWEKDFPEDPTGMFDSFKDYVESNFDKCKWIGLTIIFAQVCAVILAAVIRTQKPDIYSSYYVYNSDDEENAPSRLTLLDHVDLPFASKKMND